MLVGLVGWLLLGSCLGAVKPLNVFIWSEYLDPEVVKEFEARRGAKVTVDLYEDSESMMAKLQSGGDRLYDLVVPPDHTVPVLAKLGLLAPLRRERLPNFANLDPAFVGPQFDTNNTYTVAYQWGTVGIYYRRSAWPAPPDSWAVFFEATRPPPGPLVLIDSMRDAIGAALKFGGHSLNSTEPAALKEARERLWVAKRRSAAMEGSVGGRNRVLARSAVAAIVYSGEAARGISEDGGTAYVIPREGSQIWVDNLAIPARAPHRELAEDFIDFLLDARIGARISNFTQFATPNRAAREFIRAEDLRNPAIYPPPEMMARLEFLQDLGGRARLHDQVWTQVKAH